MSVYILLLDDGTFFVIFLLDRPTCVMFDIHLCSFKMSLKFICVWVESVMSRPIRDTLWCENDYIVVRV